MTDKNTEAPRVVVTDYSFGELSLETAILEPLGCTITAGQCRTEQEAIELLAGAEYVMTQFAPITSRVIDTLDNARVIVRYGIGVDNVDIAAAAARKIPVCNVPDYCIDEVADHTIGMILSLTRQMVRVASSVKAGQWASGVPLSSLHAVKELTTGVVGTGRIGREVISRLKPFKTPILAYDPILSDAQAQALGVEKVSLDYLIEHSDLITLHCPSTPETKHMINAQSLARMKDGVLLINVARGTLVDMAALVSALQSGKLAGAALDVTDPEPINADSPLLGMDNVVITSHMASASIKSVPELRSRVAQTVVRSIRREPLLTCINGVTP